MAIDSEVEVRGAVSGRVPKSTFGTFFASSGASKYFCGLKPKALA